MPEYVLTVPVSPTAVKSFIDGERERFVRDLRAIRSSVETALAPLNVYKIYGRGDRQDGDELKNARKVRLKFNQFFLGKGSPEGSMWTVPDIIGFTVVVAYPSDITSVCRKLDELIDARSIVNGKPDPAGAASAHVDPSTPRSEIHTKYGRVLSTDGYFACHYNVRASGVGTDRPVCEIQIKTVLHDAWGAKSHDLTYKPSGRTNQELIDSFNLLGDTLAQIDRQSDIIRGAIARTAQVRVAKKRRVQEVVMQGVTTHAASASPEIGEAFAAIGLLPAKHERQPIVRGLIELFEAKPDMRRSVCVMLAFLSMKVEDHEIFQQTQEIVQTWVESQTDDIDRIAGLSLASLISFSGGDIANAIDLSEDAVRKIEKVDVSKIDGAARSRFHKIANSVFTSLAYYHADRVGSHEGNLAGATEHAKTALRRSIQYRDLIGYLPEGLGSSDADIRAALSSGVDARTIFSTLDNEAFVMIQTSESEAELRHAWDRLELIHRESPPDLRSEASPLLDYHEYCARVKLAELEAT